MNFIWRNFDQQCYNINIRQLFIEYQDPQYNILLGMQKSTILVSVGTTKFDPLIRITDSQQFVRFTKNLGFSEIIYQIGLNGQYVPKHGKHFRTSPHINQYFQKCDLLICHGGAGTLLQNLINKKFIVSVANTELLHNHQVEIIEQLDKQGYILGFQSVQDFGKGYNKIQKFIENQNHQTFKRAQKCIFNQLIFSQ